MSPHSTVSDINTACYIGTYADAMHTDDKAGMDFASFLRRNFIPTGRTMPRDVIDLLQVAWNVRQAYIPFGAAATAYQDDLAACNARRDECLTTARGLLAIHDLECGMSDEPTQPTEYTEGVCEDGAVIFRDGVIMPIADILAALADGDRLYDALQSIAASTCCEQCQEAALVAREALS